MMGGNAHIVWIHRTSSGSRKSTMFVVGSISTLPELHHAARRNGRLVQEVGPPRLTSKEAADKEFPQIRGDDVDGRIGPQIHLDHHNRRGSDLTQSLSEGVAATSHVDAFAAPSGQEGSETADPSVQQSLRYKQANVPRPTAGLLLREDVAGDELVSLGDSEMIESIGPLDALEDQPFFENPQPLASNHIDLVTQKPRCVVGTEETAYEVATEGIAHTRTHLQVAGVPTPTADVVGDLLRSPTNVAGPRYRGVHVYDGIQNCFTIEGRSCQSPTPSSS